MGQVSTPRDPPSLILTSVDRLIASNADGGLSPLASHIVLLGENAGRNLGDVDYVYVIGADSLDGGFLNSAGGEGTTIVGAKNLTALIDSIPPADDGPMVVIGYNNLARARERVGSCVVIGSGIGANIPNGTTNSTFAGDFEKSVLIGQDVLGNQRIRRIDSGPQASSVVAIGYAAARGTGLTQTGAGTQFAGTVVIGAEAMLNMGVDSPSPGCIVNSTVVIGFRAYQNATTVSPGATQNVVCIGAGAATAEANGKQNTYIGAGLTSGALDQQNHVVIGAGATHNAANTATGNVLIGSLAAMGNLLHRNIFIGYGANRGGDIAPGGVVSDNFLLETTDPSSGVRRNILYGNMGTEAAGVVTRCGLVVGLSSVAGGSRDTPGMNILKFVNGSWNGTNPGGGGFIYSLAGELHWVSTTGQDYAITPSASRGVFTVATLPLPAASIAGNTAFVTDALAPAFGVAVVGGGAVGVPVYYDGAAWNVG